MSEVDERPQAIVFLTPEVVLALHARQLERYGGGAGLRDRGLLESADCAALRRPPGAKR